MGELVPQNSTIQFTDIHAGFSSCRATATIPD